MSIIDALQKGTRTYNTTASEATINIKTGDGDSAMNITGGNVNIDTGSTGKDTIIVLANSATINTHDSDDQVFFSGDSFNINVGNDNNTVAAYGNLSIDNRADGAENKITIGDGQLNQVVAVANNLEVTAGDTDLIMASAGDDVTVNAEDGKHTVGFWGDDINMNFGDGNLQVDTLDNAFARGSFTDLGLEKYVEADSKITTTSSTQHVYEIESTDPDTVAKKYNLSDSEKAILQSVDLNAKFSDGQPLYVIVRSPKKSKAAGKDVYVVAKRDSASTNYNHMRAVSDNECIATHSMTTENVNQTLKDKTITTTNTTYTLNGVKNVNITSGDGEQANINITASTGKTNTINIDLGDFTKGKSINIFNGYSVTDTTITERINRITKQVGITMGSTTDTWNSPLVVDFDRDGQVEAKAGTGVDIDNNGTADGAATGGDKMLAMSDMNGNNKIDGSEVFGDKTVSPFTGKALNAKNGFEALKMIAQEAEAFTGTACIKDGQVDLQALKSALAKVGVNLGFISDENTSELEDLAHVASINVTDYEEQDATGDVQHRQLGSYTDTEGKQQKVNDVWFTTKK